MADRTVSVKLKADVDAYNRGVLEAKTATEGLQRSVVVLERDVKELTPETVKASKATEMLGVEAGKAKTQAKGLGEELGKTKTQTTGLGEETSKTRARIVDLGADIIKTKAALAALGDEFRKTGKLDVDAFKTASNRLRDLQQVGKQAGMETGKGFAAGMQGSLSTPVLGPILIGALAAAAIAYAPAIGAVLGGAILGGAGLGAIGAGIALQFDRVRPAAVDLGAYVKNQLTEATTSFGPAATVGIVALKREMAPLWADIQKGMSSLTPYVSNLLVKLGEGLAKLGPGLGRALESAGPVLGAIAKNLPTLLNGFNIFFDQISKGSKGAAEGIDMIMKVTSLLVAALGFAIRGLAGAFDFVVQKTDKVVGLLVKAAEAAAPFSAAAAAAAGPLKKYSEYVHGVATSYDESSLAAGGASGALDFFTGSAGAAGGAASGAAGAVRDMATSMSQSIAAMTGLDGAAISMNQSVQGLKDSIKENGKSLDINTSAGQANVQAMLSGVQSAESLRKAQLESGLSAAYADDQYLKNVESLRAVMLAAGMNAAQVDIMIGKYLNVPGLIKTNVELIGAVDAITKGQTLQETLKQLDGKVARASVVTTYMTVRQEQLNPSVGQGLSRGTPLIPHAKGGIVAHAAAGLITQPGIYRGAGDGFSVAMAEGVTGREGIVPEKGISDQRFFGLVSEIASWRDMQVVPRQAPGYAAFANSRPMGGSGGHTTYISIPINAGMGTNGYRVGEQIAEVLRPYIRSAGGGNVQVALGKPGA